jgi:hypothetical protein
MNRWTLLLSMLLCILCGCEPSFEEAFEVFTIPEKAHYSEQRHVEFLQGSSLFFKAKFDETAEYVLDDGFQDSKNKLLGFSDCNSAHHENSARFSWQWFNNTIEIYAYCYVNGQRVEQYLGTVNKNEVVSYEIRLSPSSYTFIFRDQETVIPRGSTCDVGAYLILWPYFGGQKPAPHDVTIYLKRY